MVRKSVMFSNVIVDIAFPRRSFVLSQSSCEVSASLTDVGEFFRVYFFSSHLAFLLSGRVDNEKVAFNRGEALEKF